MAEPPRRVDPSLRADPGERLRPPLRPRGEMYDRMRQPPRGQRPRRNPGRHLLRRLAMLALLVFLWSLIIGGGGLAYFALTLPDTRQLSVAERPPSVTILDSDGALIATFGDLFGQPLSLKEMSPWLPKAVIATE